MPDKSIVDKSVGLVVMMDIPGIGLVAVLRERGFFNPEKMEPESWPGVCQVTVHGRLEKNEDFLTALIRELPEELGNDFASNFISLITLNPALLGTVFGKTFYSQEGGKEVVVREVVTFAIKISPLFLKKIRLAPESGAIRLVSLDEIAKIVGATPSDKVNGAPDRRIIIMFPDEKAAVVNAFDFVSSQ
jgi:hypothetical protein